MYVCIFVCLYKEVVLKKLTTNVVNNRAWCRYRAGSLSRLEQQVRRVDRTVCMYVSLFFGWMDGWLFNYYSYYHSK